MDLSLILNVHLHTRLKAICIFLLAKHLSTLLYFWGSKRVFNIDLSELFMDGGIYLLHHVAFS